MQTHRLKTLLSRLKEASARVCTLPLYCSLLFLTIGESIIVYFNYEIYCYITKVIVTFNYGFVPDLLSAGSDARLLPMSVSEYSHCGAGAGGSSQHNPHPDPFHPKALIPAGILNLCSTGALLFAFLSLLKAIPSPGPIQPRDGGFGDGAVQGASLLPRFRTSTTQPFGSEQPHRRSAVLSKFRDHPSILLLLLFGAGGLWGPTLFFLSGQRVPSSGTRASPHPH